MIDPMSNSTVAAGMIIERGIARTMTLPDSKLQSGRANILTHEGDVSLKERELLLKQKPATIWLTGLSGSGKSTIAYTLEKKLISEGHLCYVLDGDNVRHGLNCDLGFSPEERTENIRRIAEVSRLFNDSGVIVITAFISPYCQDRNNARAIIGKGRFIEVFLDCPISVCEQRDTKGLYEKARAGKIADFTGVNAPYEAPENPELILRTADVDAQSSAGKIIDYLRGERII